MITRWMNNCLVSYPSVVRVVTDVDLGSVVGEVGEDNTEIDEAGEDTSAETSDRRGSDLSDVDGADDGSLSNAESSNEATSVDGSQAAPVTHEDSDTQDPYQAQLSRSPNTADPIANDESAVICG